jgi:shikimate dehydrogenase
VSGPPTGSTLPPPARPGRLVLLGHPVAHSLSPAFQNAALEAAGIQLAYEAVDVLPGRFEATLAALRAQSVAGNVTVPHKERLHALSAVRSDVASRAGAANAFWHADGGLLVCDNTDVAGFDAAILALGARRDGARVLCLGAGGGAAAVCAAVAAWPDARVFLLSRSAARAARLAARFPGVVEPAHRPPAGLTLAVNATPVGLLDEDLPIDLALLPRDTDVMDLAYRRGTTRWVREALASGRHAIDGREMLLHQGALAFERWLGVKPDIRAMRRALEEELGRS